MNVINLDSENLQLDWVSFNLEGLVDPKIIAGRLLKYFTPHVLIDGVPIIGYHGLKKKYKVSIHQYTGSKDSYIFTSDRNPNQKLRRETITMDVNKVTHSVSKLLPAKPNLTSHSFRIGYITQLWKDSKDIEFVKQSIGHQKLYTTSAYVNKLSKDRKRIDRL